MPRPVLLRTYAPTLVLFAATALLAACDISPMPHNQNQPAPLDPPVYCYRSLGRVQCYTTAQPEGTVGSFVGTQQQQELKTIKNPDGSTSAVETDVPAGESPQWPMPPRP